jgi:hypothetical protein
MDRFSPTRPFAFILAAGILSACGTLAEETCDEPPCAEENGNGEAICDLEPGIVLGDPIEAEAGIWTWVDFPGTQCMNGSETGLAVNLKPDAAGTLIYLQGGGLCFDGYTCNGVANPNGFSRADFDAMVAAGHHNIGIFNRDDAENPFRDYDLVFIPYCSGDLFGGANASGFGGRIYDGWANMEAFLARLVPTFADSPHVVLGGSSAGGYGATLNYDRAQTAFTCTPVHLLNDAGPTFSDAWTAPCLQTHLRNAFNLDVALPADCEDCFGADGGGLMNLLPYLAEKHPERRLALLTTTADEVIRFFMSYGYSEECDTPFPIMPAADFQAGVYELRDEITIAYPNASMFIQVGDGHTFLGYRPASITTAGTHLGAWLDSMLGGDAGWMTVGP